MSRFASLIAAALLLTAGAAAPVAGFGPGGPGFDGGPAGYGPGFPGYGVGGPGFGPGYATDPRWQGRGRPRDYRGGGSGLGQRGKRQGYGRGPTGHGGGPRGGPLNPAIVR